jgi:hypothetical protein
MAEAAYAAGPALFGAPRFLGPRAYSILFFRIFCSLFQRGAQTVCQYGAPKSPSPSENARPQIKFKKRGTRKRGPKRFFGPCFSGGSQRAQGPQKRQAPKFKTRGPKRFFWFPVSARDPNNAGLERVQGPQNGAPK